MSRSAWAALVLLAGALFHEASAQPVDHAAPRWRAGTLLSYEHLKDGQPPWTVLGVSLRRELPGTTLLFEGQRVSRFDRADYAVGVDAYRDLWRGAYGNLRVQAAPGAAVLPVVDATAELYQAAARLWELGAGYRAMWFEDDRVDLYAASVGRYAGAYYLRVRATLVPRGNERNVLLTALARRYFAAEDAFAEVLVGHGREVTPVGAGPAVQVRDVLLGAVRLQRPVYGPVVLTLGAGYTHDAVFARWGVTAGTAVDW